MSSHPNEAAPSLQSILYTEELDRRPARAPDYKKENEALVALTQALADSPQTILQTLSDTILKVLHCGSSGVSLLTSDDGGKNFYWPAVSGDWKSHIGEGTPRDFGPCGTVLDHDSPLLFKRVERYFTYLEPVKPVVEEALLVPFHIENVAVGTVWAIAHDPARQFDAEDRRQLESLARFASAAFHSVNSLQANRQFAAIVESSDDAIISKDLNGVISSWNAGAERIFGHKAHEIVGQHITKIIPSDLYEEEKEILRRLRAGERIDHYETVRLKSDGSRVHISLTISPVRNAQGRVVGASKIARDITERKRVEQAVRESEMATRLLQVQDEERRRISRELHDGVGQLISAMSMNFSLVAKEKDKLSPRAVGRMEETGEMLQQAAADIRTVSYLLHPPLLDEMGLQSALQWYLDGFTERSKIAAHLEIAGELDRLPQEYELCLFRIAQECLTNIHRHSKASSATVHLFESLGRFEMEIKDNGQGMDQEMQASFWAGKSHGVGLRGMRERIAVLGGAFAIESSGKGTSVLVSLPFSDAQKKN